DSPSKNEIRNEIVEILILLEKELMISSNIGYCRAIEIILGIIKNSTAVNPEKVIVGEMATFAEKYFSGSTYISESLDKQFFQFFVRLAKAQYIKYFENPQPYKSAEAPRTLHYVWTGKDLTQDYVRKLLSSVYHFLDGAKQVKKEKEAVVKIWTTNPLLIMRAILNSDFEGALTAEMFQIVDDVDDIEKTTATSPAKIFIINLASLTVQNQLKEICGKMLELGLECLKKEGVFSPSAAVNIEQFWVQINHELYGLANFAAWADIIRLIALWLGGLYLDTDCKLVGPLLNINTPSLSLAAHGNKGQFDSFILAILGTWSKGNNCVMSAQPHQLVCAVILASIAVSYRQLYKLGKIVIDPDTNKMVLTNLDKKRARFTAEDERLIVKVSGPTKIAHIVSLCTELDIYSYIPPFEDYLALFLPDSGNEPSKSACLTGLPGKVGNLNDTPNKVEIECHGTWMPSKQKEAVAPNLPQRPRSYSF
ncbi:MAG: hypothetical protein ACHP9Y_01050, partial [Gammaproteobacteria bacterium]